MPVHSVREGGEVSDLVANILASVAEEESRALGERVAAASNTLTGNGWYLTGQVPWGYRMRPATAEERAQGAPINRPRTDPIEVPWVQEAFRRAGEGRDAACGAPLGDRPADRGPWWPGPRLSNLSHVLVHRSTSGDCIHGGDDVLARPLAAGSHSSTMRRGCGFGITSMATGGFRAKPASSIC